MIEMGIGERIVVRVTLLIDSSTARALTLGRESLSFEKESSSLVLRVDVAPEIWHARLGHPADGKMEKIGIIQADKNCDACSVAKMKSLPHQRSTGPEKYEPGDLVVGDYKLVKNANLENEDV
jgi:hypothetical protein